MANKKRVSQFSVVGALHTEILPLLEVSGKSGKVRLSKKELKDAVEKVFSEGAKRAAGKERVRFPVVGALVCKEVKARKAGKGKNPFTGEPMKIKARPATRKPRWSFPKTLRELFGNRKNW